MALTKVKLIADGVIDVDHLAASHGITTDNIGEGSALYYTDARVLSYLTTNSYATEGFVTTAVSNLVDAAPGTLDTLNELAAALGDDPNFATTVTNSIATKLPLAGGTLTGSLNIQKSDDARLTLSDTSDSSNITVRADLTNSIYSNKSLNIYTENADHISFSTNGQSSERVRVYSNGNVELRTVNAQLRFQNSVGPAPFIANAGSGDQDLYISTGGSERMRIDSSGNVEINGSSGPLFSVKSTASGTPTAFVYASTNGADFGSLTNHPTRFYVNNSEKMRIDSSGSVGIGINSPSSYDSNADNLVIGSTGPEDKNGITIVGGDTGGRGAIYFADTTQNSAGYITYFHSNNSMLFGTSDNTRMTITSNGSVGIGTNSPQEKLHVYGGVGLINVSDNWQQSSSKTSLIRGGNFQTTISNETNALKIYPVGSDRAVGDYWGGIEFLHLDPDSNNWGGSYTGGQFWIGGRIIDQPGQERSAFVIATNNATTAGTHPTERMVVMPDGNVGIGTTSPSAKLHVSDSTIVDGDLYIGGSSSLRHPALNRFATVQSGTNGSIVGYNMAIIDGSNNRRGSLFMDDSTGLWGLDHTYSSGSMDFVIRVVGGELMRVRSDGNVGIGVTSPSEKLDVNGRSYFRDLVGINGEMKGITIDSGYGTNGRVGLMKYPGYETMLVSGTGTKVRLGHRTDNSRVADASTPTIREDFIIESDGTTYIQPSVGSNVIIATGGGGGGRVGIGTTSPTGKFNSYISAARQITHNGNGGDLSVISDNNSTPVMYIKGTGTADLLNIFYGSTEVTRITSSSLILFDYSYGVRDGWFFNDAGRTQSTIDADSYGAEVILVNNRTAGDCSILQYRTTGTIRGSIYANTSGLSFNNPSDYRLKNNVQTLSGSLDKITSLNPVSYTLNNVDNPVNRVGFIAHEVAEHIPSIVTGEKDDVYTQEDINNGVSGFNVGDPKYQSLSYSSDEMITHLVGAIKELKAEVEALKQQLNG